MQIYDTCMVRHLLFFTLNRNRMNYINHSVYFSGEKKQCAHLIIDSFRQVNAEGGMIHTARRHLRHVKAAGAKFYVVKRWTTLGMIECER